MDQRAVTFATRRFGSAASCCDCFGQSRKIIGLTTLMLLQHARAPARFDAAGDLVLLEDQNRNLWDSKLIAEGLALIDKAMRHRRAAEGGKTRYTARVRHWSVADREAHEKRGFHEGWGRCADQLAALVAKL